MLPHKLILRPREGHDIRIESVDLDISPTHQLEWQRDVYDNSVAKVTFDGNINPAGAPIFKLFRSRVFDRRGRLGVDALRDYVREQS